MHKKADEKEKRLYRLLCSLARVRILFFFSEQKDQGVYQRQIMFEAGLTLHPVQRELSNTASLVILFKKKLSKRLLRSDLHEV
jgi:hypothetical protein